MALRLGLPAAALVMYSNRVSGRKRSVMDHLGSGGSGSSSRPLQRGIAKLMGLGDVNFIRILEELKVHADAALDSLLESFDLQKYSINFQAKEVDMKPLVHMNEGYEVFRNSNGPSEKDTISTGFQKKKSSKSLPTS